MTYQKLVKLLEEWPSADTPVPVLRIEEALDSGILDLVEELRRRVVAALEDLERRPGPAEADALVAAHRVAEALGDAGRFLTRATDAVGEFADHYPELEAKPYEIEGENEEDEPEKR